LEVRDVTASVDFYCSVLGFEPVRLREYLAGEAPFASVRVNNETIIDLFPKKMWRTRSRPANPHHICFTVEQKPYQALKRRMKRQGIAIVRSLSKSFGAQGIGRSVYFHDPDQVMLEARYYPRVSSRAPGRPH
jgi:catechol 2,3-dioxygenase-like lactoylglutathione lyase family enzyme